MTAAELEEAAITDDWYGGQTPPKGLSAVQRTQWQAQHEQESPTYHRIDDGSEVDPHTRILLPTPDPVPHYNRGRTYIEPRLNTALPVSQPTTATTLTTAERKMLRYALDLAQEMIYSLGDEFTSDDQAAVDSLRGMTDEVSSPPE